MKKRRREDWLGIGKMFSSNKYPPLPRPAFMGYFTHPSAQQQRCISKQVQKAEVNHFFNLLTSPQMLDIVEAQLPEHRESKYPPTLVLSMFWWWVKLEVSRYYAILMN
jgi:hypothetical protein